MTYHLARIGNWIQNDSINFYPTNINRQLYLGPFAEYFLYIITVIDHSDKFLFFGQWLSMIGSLILVSLITKDVLKKDNNSEIDSALIALTIPMGLLQSISTQNDYFLTFFITSFFYFLLKPKSIIKEKNKFSITNSNFFLYFSFSLALLTKMTAIIYLFIPTLYWIINRLKEKKLTSIILFTIIFLIFNSSHFYRNQNYFGNILGSKTSQYIVTTIYPQKLFINLIKNTSLHFQLNSKKWNNIVIYSIKNIATILNTNINEKSISYLSIKYYITTNNYYHDYAGNFIHTILIVFALFHFFFKKEVKINRKIYFFIASSFIGILTILKWQPWATRLHLPIFILSSPIIIILVNKLHPILKSILITILIVTSFQYILFNTTQPLAYITKYDNTEKTRYIKRPKIYDDYHLVSNYILNNNIHSIGILSNGNDWEYPIWYYLYKNNHDFTYNHIIPTKKPFYTKTGYTPNWIIDIRTNILQTNDLIINKHYFEIIINKQNIKLWKKL